MRDWHHERRTDLALRLFGAVVCGTSWLALSRLMHMRVSAPPGSPGAIVFLLAAIGFVAASGGMALLVVGHHLLDEVEISARWRERTVADEPIELPPPHGPLDPR